MSKTIKILKRYIILNFMQSKLYAWIILHIVPFIRFSVYYTSFKGWMYQRGYRILRPGDIVLTNDKWKLTSILIPGEFSHAALCVDKDDEFEIAEMVHTGFTRSCFFDLCKESTRVVIIRCKDWDVQYVKKVLTKCLSFEGVLYDVQFQYGIKSLYCSELIVVSDIEKRLKADDSDLCNIGQRYVSPTDIYHAKNVEVVWDSKFLTQ